VLTLSAVLVALPELAHAQQSGLFPLHPIRRERVPCPEEDPIYRLYRTQYFGYFPTQWRTFPSGWHLHNPGAPNVKEELLKTPIESQSDLSMEGDEEDDQGAEPAREPQQPRIPAPPEDERNPFSMDNPNDAGTPPAAPRVPNNRPAVPPPADDPSSILPPESDRPGETAPAPRASASNRYRDRNARMARRLESEDGPLLATPDTSLPNVEEASLVEQPTEPGLFGGPGASAPIATQPTPRRSRLGAFFSGDWLRR
jgi:hypothetical protein